MPASSEQQRATLEKFLKVWERWQAEEWLAIFTSDFKQVTMPFGMGIPARSRSEVEFAIPILMKAVKNYKVTFHNVVHDADKNQAAVYASSTGDTEFGPWTMEYAAFLTFSEDGLQIAKVEEMLDSAFLAEFAPKLGKLMKEATENGGH